MTAANVTDPVRGRWSAWNPAARSRAKFRAWWQSRVRPTDSFTLTQRTVYILPTGPGFMLAATLLVLLVASINFQLNLGFILTFALAGSAVVGMHIGHNTLRGITLNLIAPTPHFVGENTVFDVKLRNDRTSTRHGIGLTVLGTDHWVWADVPPQGSAQLQVAWKPTRRGLTPLPALTAETRFPMGTFRVWTVWRPASQMLVYPAPEPFPPPLPAGVPRALGAASLVRSVGEVDGVRPYRRGDPLKLIVWKKAAKAMAMGSGDLISRDSQQNQGSELWLDFGNAGSGDVELRLSRLCAWVLKADKLAMNYGLRLPLREIAPSQGEAHRRQCLEALALC